MAHPALRTMIATWNAAPPNARFADDPAADQLVKENLSAFLMAASIDRGGLARKLWEVPFRLLQKWEQLDTGQIQAMDPLSLASDPIIARAPSMTRRLDLAKSIISVAQTVEAYGGNPERIFEGNIDTILNRLQQIFGVGPGIARMILIQRMLFFGLNPPGNDLLPKLDVLVVRVLTRTGVVTTGTDKEVRAAIQEFSSREIAFIDQVAWDIGQTRCFPKQPDCPACPLCDVCDYARFKKGNP